MKVICKGHNTCWGRAECQHSRPHFLNEFIKSYNPSQYDKCMEYENGHNCCCDSLVEERYLKLKKINESNLH